MFKTLLVANRGEIAVRIIRAARDLGIGTVAVFSDADRQALHVRLADRAYYLGESPARHSYLAIDRVLAAAGESGADAVHPGYGLLSENPDFARAVLEAGLIFVGPDPGVIATMGDKVAARAAADACGVPTLPGSVAVDAGSAVQAAGAIGFPLIVKAMFGGGGRGIRIVRDMDALTTALAEASREAASSFGRGEVFLERYLERPRHVEVQVFGDGKAQAIHLGDRDCSVQRRHQKMVEEAPAPDLASALRDSMQQAAVKLASSVGYAGAGTVEFLVDADREHFYFLEMNTRLQVEHGVTELITGLDLVEWQLRIAAGQALSLKQTEVNWHGHAIEARIAAEEPGHDFRPAAGRITELKLPSGPWVRSDFGFESGDDVPPFYDSMIGKVLAWGETREAARRKLARALQELRVGGIRSNKVYLASVIDAPAFAAVQHDIQWIEREWLPRSAPAVGNEAGGDAAPEPNAGQFQRRLLRTPQGVVDLDVFAARHGAPVAAARGARARSSVASQGEKKDADVPTAPIDGTIVEVLVAVGARIEPGMTLAVLEAMKMEMPVVAGRGGLIEAVHVEKGATVKAGTVLFSLGP